MATTIAVNRLHGKKIFVSETSRVNWAGSVSVCCFDKTGTLTEDRLIFERVRLRPEHIGNSWGIHETSSLPDSTRELMATCHSLSMVDGRPQGDAMEVELMRSSGWEMGAAISGNQCSNPRALPHLKTIIIRHFEFTADKARSSSLVRRPNGSLVLYTKGSPEALEAIVNPKSIPDNFREILNEEVTKCNFLILYRHECQDENVFFIFVCRLRKVIV